MTDNNVPYDPTHPIYDLGECVLVSTTGAYLVEDGKVWEVGVEEVTPTLKYVNRDEGWE